MVTRNGLFQAFFYILLFSLVFLLFFRFTEQNRDRIQEQNRVYAEDAARQTAKRIEGQFIAAMDLIEIYAYFLDQTGASSQITPKVLKKLEASTPFDAIRFTNTHGINIASDGTVNDTRDRGYYIEGMKGKSGVSIVFNSRIFNQTILGFYAPLHGSEGITGVLHGSYLADNYLHNMLDTSYFGKLADVFLCDADGRIIATSTNVRYQGHIIQALLKKGKIGEKIAKEAIAAFNDRKNATFEGGPESSIGNLCIVHVPKFDYMLIQIFPKSITRAMSENANKSGIELEAGLLALFAIYAAFLFLRWHLQRRRLEGENRELGSIIKGMNTLFDARYCDMDVKKHVYSYLTKGGNYLTDLPPSGSYPDFLEYHSKPLVTEDEKGEFKRFFALDNLVETLSTTGFVTYACHVERNGQEGWENIISICLERDDDGRPARILFVRQVVTEMKQRELSAQKKLSEMGRKERQYRIAVISNAMCNFEFNVTRNWLDMDIVEDVDGKQTSILGVKKLMAPCKASDAFKVWLPDILPESVDDYARCTDMDYLLESHERGEMEVDLDFWARSLAGPEICIRLSFYLTKDDLTGDVMAMAVGRDITAQVNRQRQQTRDLQDALMQAQHANAAKTTFLSNMSHDIRTPMNAIIGFATIASTHLDNREQVKDCLQKVLSSSNHLLSLINDILDMSRIESGKMQIKKQECNIPSLMHTLVNIIQPQVKAKQLDLFIDTYEVANEDVITDPLKINQIFINLLSNAVKYTAAGGAISFRITQKPAFRHGYADYVFTVKDNGIGMSPEFVRHIFEPFTRETTTTLSGIQGTGLGMAITKNIVEMMDGHIEVESEPGKGSTFTVTLTIKLQDKQGSADEISELEGQRALVVDDDFHVCDSVDKMLKKIGLRSEWTTSAREAVYRTQIAHDDGDPFHTYIIDWHMPEMNGVDTTRKIRSIVGDDAPIIILTAYEWADIEEEAREAGVTAFCAKPLFMSDLRNALISSHCGHEDKEEKEAIPDEDFHGKRILVVDDVEMNREVAEFILTESGFIVEMAPDGTDAVSMVRKSSEHYYDAILMDVQMPIMNGYEATKAIRALVRKDVCDMPIIAMTANALEEDKAEAFKSGMDAHIAKPVEIKAFFEVLKKFLKK